ncbi:AEC family transporter [Enterococcus hulanensis]|uniref:AEC family transporter n=1 Tax=Enterococcus hulanensis TaxID=2559929 RepID=A0ABU3F2S7_9ENTE|nr:AEC family transporter [Enterococcus hulanensis]MDT2601424.1 AEC family transporter [Enterococcus hulanensis]MDT2611033.1 AEC family transporter [Enterococcus hulanensis]MDT2618438.1 AEC family transporter [Enterococcus hulanensis]MDT2629359.1 AEC family transporter [Enterococcus hulanensis]MDT2656921.1 AEC family transporter [Enterococcus hulanensis]
MRAVLLNSLGLFVIILIGYLTKRLNILMKADGSMISKIVVNVTLPAAIIVNLQFLEVKNQLLLLIIAGLLLNLVMIIIGHFLSKGQDQVEREFLMYSVSGYNIGNFAIPFVQSFMPLAIPILSFFDIGNSVMLAGGSNVVIEGISGSNAERPTAKKVLGRLGRSVPFLCYLFMLVFRILKIDLPEAVFQIAQPIANANTFLSMFMIGLFLELRLPKKDLALVFRVLAIKYGVGILLVVLFMLMPFPNMIKIVLCLVSVGPIPTFGVINSVAAGMRAEVVGFTSSLSFLISLPLMTSLLLFL